MDRRIATTPAQVKCLEDLVSLVAGEEYALFETKQKALMFAAGLGFFLKRSTPLGSRDAGTAIRFEIFEKALDDGFVSALAVASRSDLGVLGENRQEELIQAFEEFASAGLAELQLKVLGQADPLQALIAVMNVARHPQDASGLDGLDKSILVNLLGR